MKKLNLKQWLNKFGIGGESDALALAQNRLVFCMIVFVVVYLGLVIRLVELGVGNREGMRLSDKSVSSNDFFTQRASIFDCNGNILASNLITASLYAHPKKIVDKEKAIEDLCQLFGAKYCQDIKSKVSSDKNFVWLKRHLTPAQQQKIHDLGIAGIGFMQDERRVYPHANLFSHVVGFVDVDGNGLGGVEKYFDQHLKNSNEPIYLSIDMRIQQILRDELIDQARAHNAIGGSGVIMNAKTGEIIAMASLPDFDPNSPSTAGERQRFNQVTLGAYEMGSTFKVLTLAMALDGKYVGLNDVFNTDSVIKIGKKQISNYRGKGGLMSVPEILMYSSNIGSAQLAMKVGMNKQKSYFKDFGLLEKLSVELPEKAHPLYPSAKLWNHSSMITMSYGHGLAVTPLHVVKAMAAVANDGELVEPTLIRRAPGSEVMSHKVLSDESSDKMRRILRMVVTDGFGKKADVDGYFVGGKTGTAEKVSGRGYAKHANLASFIGVFPAYDPQYVMVVLIDEALANKENGGFTTGGMIAAPVAGRIIEKAAPILGIMPKDSDDLYVINRLHLDYIPKNPNTLQKLKAAKQSEKQN